MPGSARIDRTARARVRRSSRDVGTTQGTLRPPAFARNQKVGGRFRLRGLLTRPASVTAGVVTSQKYREEWHGSWYNVAMRLTLPEIPEAENTPLVRQLLEIIRTQQDRIQQLEDEILRLKGLKTRPVIAPSPLEHPPRPPREPGQK